MTKHITDSERLTQAILHKKEKELAISKREIELLRKQVEAMQFYIKDLQNSRKILCGQVNDLVLNQHIHA